MTPRIKRHGSICGPDPPIVAAWPSHSIVCMISVPQLLFFLSWDKPTNQRALTNRVSYIYAILKTVPFYDRRNLKTEL